jgi:hypothetical protein
MSIASCAMIQHKQPGLLLAELRLAFRRAHCAFSHAGLISMQRYRTRYIFHTTSSWLSCLNVSILAAIWICSATHVSCLPESAAHTDPLDR